MCDIADTEKEMPFPDNTLDIITVIFVLSAIKPDRYERPHPSSVKDEACQTRVMHELIYHTNQSYARAYLPHKVMHEVLGQVAKTPLSLRRST